MPIIIVPRQLDTFDTSNAGDATRREDLDGGDKRTSNYIVSIAVLFWDSMVKFGHLNPHNYIIFAQLHFEHKFIENHGWASR